MRLILWDVHDLLNPEQVAFEMRLAEKLRIMKMEDGDYDVAIALLSFIGSKPNGIALSGEIISLLREKPYNFSLKRINDLLQYLKQNNFICVGGTVERRHPLGNLSIQLTSMRERKDKTIH